MSDSTIYPIFSSVICAKVLNGNFDSELDIIKNQIFHSTEKELSERSFISEGRKLLNKTPKLKKEIKHHFEKFKNDVLRYESTNFDLTTSWATKVEKNCFCQYHQHKNSFYSGVFYFQNDSSPIEFTNTNIDVQSIKVNQPSEWNILNSSIWKIQPQKGLLIFFPSYLLHRITSHKSNSTRYSLAFNFMPKGKIGGTGDSEISLSF